MTKCPLCGLSVPEVVPIDIDLREKIQTLDPSISKYSLQEEVCRSCLQNYRRRVGAGSGGALMAQARAQDQRKAKLWRSRTGLVKQGHTLMASRLYSEAAISYEKYIRLLELVFDCAPGGLNPAVLKEAARTAELTVIAGVYWDLVRVYDSSDKYGERQKLAAKQLGLFVPYTPIFSDIIKKAAVFQKQARHPEVIKSLLSTANKKRARCFIATSAFEAPWADEVLVLRDFRDQKLKTTFWGRKFVGVYYQFSPKVACFLDKHSYLKPVTRAVLRFVIKCVS